MKRPGEVSRWKVTVSGNWHQVETGRSALARNWFCNLTTQLWPVWGSETGGMKDWKGTKLVFWLDNTKRSAVAGVGWGGGDWGTGVSWKTLGIGEAVNPPATCLFCDCASFAPLWIIRQYGFTTASKKWCSLKNTEGGDNCFKGNYVFDSSERQGAVNSGPESDSRSVFSAFI